MGSALPSRKRRLRPPEPGAGAESDESSPPRKHRALAPRGTTKGRSSSLSASDVSSAASEQSASTDEQIARVA